MQTLMPAIVGGPGGPPAPRNGALSRVPTDYGDVVAFTPLAFDLLKLGGAVLRCMIAENQAGMAHV